METAVQAILFFAMIFGLKVLDNMFDATKVIFLQKGRGAIAGTCLAVSAFINYFVIKIIAQSDGAATMLVAAIAAGTGCGLASIVSSRFLRSVHVNVIMSHNREAITEIHEFLTERHIKHKVEDTYNCDLTDKTLTITAFPDTNAKAKEIKEFIKKSETKFGHVIVE